MEVAKDLSTKLWVENHQYAAALNSFQQILADPPTAMDSIYAAIDYAVTTFRQQNEDTVSGSLDCAAANMSATEIAGLRQRIEDARPALPKTSHAGYALPPTEFRLDAAYPNPFNPTTTIGYYLPENARVRIDIFNIMGQRVVVLVDGMQNVGRHTVLFDGSALSTGVYIYQIKAGKFSDTKKMLLLK